MVSLKDIAKECGVSVATVSKALNDQSDISTETKERVCATAKEMGYLPNFSARALKTNRTHNIGVLFVDEASSGLTHDYFAGVLDSFKRAVEAGGYDMTFINCSKDAPTKMTYLEHCRYHNFDGVVLACINFDEPQVVELVQSEIPLVTIDHLFNNRIAVQSDNVHGIEDLVHYIVECGHRKIAYIHGVASSVTSARLCGFYRELERLGIEIPEEYVKEAAYRDTKGAYEATLELLDLEQPPTCILYPDDFAALGGMNAIREKGLRIPEDISVAGYDGIRVLRHLRPRLSTLRQDQETIGRTAGEKLMSLIERPKTTVVEQIVVPGNLFEGETIARM